MCCAASAAGCHPAAVVAPGPCERWAAFVAQLASRGWPASVSPCFFLDKQGIDALGRGIWWWWGETEAVGRHPTLDSPVFRIAVCYDGTGDGNPCSSELPGVDML